jgi:hypothetical protein
MLTNEPSIHHTITKKVRRGQQDGWEFECPICGYRALYIAQLQAGSPQLEILHIGDAQARHLSNQPRTSWGMARPVQVMADDDDDDETWLTPELRQQMEDLLQDVNMGDW